MKGLAKLEPGYKKIGIMDFPEPTPGPGEVKILVKEAGLCGSDIHIWHDTIVIKTRPPVVIGHEFAGEVVEIGEGVTLFEKGDRVVAEPNIGRCGKCDFCKDGLPSMCLETHTMGYWYNGGFAKYTVVPQQYLHRIPDNVSYTAAALTEPLTCVIHAICYRSRVNAGDVALVSGPGAIGLMAMQVAKVQGAKVVVSGTDADAHRLELAEKLGADRTVNIQKEDLQSVLMEMTGGYGPDVVLECSGAPAATNMGLKLLRGAGRFIQVGLPGSRVNFDVEQICYKDVKFYGTMGSITSDWRIALKLLASGQVQTEPLVSHKLPITEWEKAFELFESHQGLKLVLTPVDD